MRDKIQKALSSSRADYTEIRIENRDNTTVAYRGKRLETAQSTIDVGGVVRCLVRDHGWGVVTFNNMDDLNDRVRQAYECAQVAHTDEPIELAPVPITDQRITASLENDFRHVPMLTKKALVEEYNNIIWGYSNKIVDSFCSYGDSFNRRIFANSNGTYLDEEQPLVGIVCVATARDGDNVQQANDSQSNQVGFDGVLGFEERARAAAQKAVDLLSAQSVVGGQYAVVCNQELAGVFIHEAFGHLSEADFVYQNPKAREMMVLGRRFGREILNVFDDGAVPGQRGTHPFDDEGVSTKRNYLIKNGILVGRLHSRETAAKMAEQPTGNARAINYRHAPIVRMTNTAIEGGATSFEEMIADIKLGVYACAAYGGQTMLENFSFSSGYAFMIRDGRIAEMVKDVILAGNLFTTLMNIDAIGNDFTWINKGGGCGKDGQDSLPVSFGSPHIRIQNVVIGGK
jgi:TldD protein